MNTASTYKSPEIFWKKIKQLTGNSTTTTDFLYNNNNEKIYSNQGQEYLHREIWERVFKDEVQLTTQDDPVINYLNENIDRTSAYQISDISRLNQNPLDMHITTEEIKTICNKIRKTCPVENEIKKILLTHLSVSAITRFAEICTATLSAGYFPSPWKKSIIKLIPKAGKPQHQPSNYGPISLLEVQGKIFERIINNRLKSHLEENNKYNNHQFGFRQGRGTDMALAITTEQISHYKSDKGQCQLVLRNISKAFDKVWHIGIKYKSLKLNLPPTTEKILCNFVDNREAKK